MANGVSINTPKLTEASVRQLAQSANITARAGVGSLSAAFSKAAPLLRAAGPWAMVASVALPVVASLIGRGGQPQPQPEGTSQAPGASSR